jgi:hypothetical protein
MFVRMVVGLTASWLFLSSCANTEQTAHSDSDSILREPESDHKIHGEVGAMYGASAR